ncbi:MAG TPA: glycoside hydrolase family 3 N-terminal domain-containing protein, partial [Gemmatimonadaceae bacterium]
LDSAKLDYAINQRHIGALLNVFNVAMSPEEWRDANNMIARFSARAHLKIPVIYGIDAVHGQIYQTRSTIFPQNIAMAATFDRSLMRRASEITAYETRASGIPWNFSPVLDLGRQPLWPRYYETFGEDPYVASAMGVEAVLGYQRDPWPGLAPLLGANAAGKPKFSGPVFVAASAKHYLGYSMPLSGKDRTTAWIPERQLRELFLPSFRAAINAGIRTVMVNSSDINGVPVHADPKILTDLLRKELGFTGVTDSDWEDIIRLYRIHGIAKTNKEAVREAVMAGIDMSMVPNEWSFTDDLLALVKEGKVPMSRIDEAVRRILRMKFELGVFENNQPDPAMMANIGAPAFQAVSKEAAAEAVTLLKNDRELLPLKKSAKVFVTGPTADHLPSQYGGWSFTWQGTEEAMYPKAKTLLAAIRDQVGEANVKYVPGAKINDTLDIAAAVAGVEGADVAIVALGEDAYAETPGNIDDLTLPAAQIRLARAIEATGVPVVLALYHGRPRIIRDAVDGARAIVTGYETGPYGGEAVAAVLFGDVNPSGRLPFSWPRYTGAILNAYDRARPADIGGTDSTNRGYNPEWAFGHGLSYTTYAYSDLKVATPRVAPGDSVRVSVTVKNTGNRAGTEPVLLYVRDLVASVDPPMRRLRRFDRVSLQPGESKTVSFAVAARELSFVGRDNKLVLEPGAFDAIVGPLTSRFEVTGGGTR